MPRVHESRSQPKNPTAAAPMVLPGYCDRRAPHASSNEYSTICTVCPGHALRLLLLQREASERGASEEGE